MIKETELIDAVKSPLKKFEKIQMDLAADISALENEVPGLYHGTIAGEMQLYVLKTLFELSEGIAESLAEIKEDIERVQK